MAQQLHQSKAMTTAQNKDTMSKPGRKGRSTTLITSRTQV